MTLDLEQIRQAPKALLHDHLDGGLRPATIVALADAVAQLAADPAAAREMGQRRAEFVRRKHSWAARAAAIDGVLRAALAERAGAAKTGP